MTKKILIVENESRVADALDTRLRSRGYASIVLDDVSSAVQAFDEHRPDLVVISLTLNAQSGQDLCRTIRALPLGALVPILFMGTGEGPVRGVTEAIALGADHYFTKPNALTELVSKIATYIGPGTGLDLNLAESDPELTPAGQGLQGARDDWSHLDGLLRPQKVEDDTEADEDLVEPNSQLESDDSPQNYFGLPPITGESSVAEPLESSSRQGQTPPPASPELARMTASPPERPPETTSVLGQLKAGQPVPLEERGIEAVLYDAAEVRLTGRIEVSSGGVLRRIFVEAGRVVYTDSSATGEDLSAYLAAEGFVTSMALEQARVRATQVGVSPEEVLIEAGLLSPDDVHNALRGHILDRIFDFFSIERGESVVIRGGPRPIDPVDLGYPPKRIILDGIRRKFGRLRLYRVFGTATSIPRRPDEAARHEWSLRSDESAILGSVDGRRSVLEIARKTRQGDVDVLAILYGFSILGLVNNPHAQLGTASSVPAIITERALAPQTMDEMPGYADLVQQKYAAVRDSNYFFVLGVDRGATGAEIRTAYEDNRRRFDPHRVSKTSPLWRQVDEIHKVVQDAYDMLSNERLRQRYESALS